MFQADFEQIFAMFVLFWVPRIEWDDGQQPSQHLLQNLEVEALPAAEWRLG
jgi:hypothetical protein